MTATDPTPPDAARADRDLFETDPATLAVRLIGCTLVRHERGVLRAGRIVETEAYLGVDDLAAHSAGWRRTPRTEPMFGPPGTAYVFLTYGMHHCFNVVCGRIDEPVAVLVRALEPIHGLEAMRRARAAARRAGAAPPRDTELCSGPARMCQALDIDRRFTGVDLISCAGLWIEPGGVRTTHPWPVKPGKLVNAARIGVDYAGPWAAAPLRWYEADNPHVSVRIPSGRAGA